MLKISILDTPSHRRLVIEGKLIAPWAAELRSAWRNATADLGERDLVIDLRNLAERAGVSVGTLYRYYPNKQSLLFAVLEHHLNTVAARFEAACNGACHKPLAEMIREMVEAFVDAKMERADISVALYRVSAEVGGPELIKRIAQRSRKAVEAMLQTATNIKSPPDKLAIDTMLAAMAGAIRSLLEAKPLPGAVRKSKEQLVLLCQSYMMAATANRV